MPAHDREAYILSAKLVISHPTMSQPLPLRLLRRRPPPDPNRIVRRIPYRSARFYTSSQSTSSVEVPPPLTQRPPTHPFSRLQRTLQTLQTTGHGPPSRIELALRGLEQRDAPIRIAVMGAVVSIVPPLLGASFSTEELLAWVASHDKPGRGLLIRHGTSLKLTTPTGSPLSILTAPTAFLKDVELVVSSHCGKDPLVPVFQATDIPGARVIKYPVHKTVLCAGEGAEGVRRLVEFPMERGQWEGVLRVLAMPGAGKAAEGGKVMVVDSMSGQVMERVTEWLLEGAASPDGDGVKPAVNALLHDILLHARLSLTSKPIESPPPPSAQAATEGDTAESLATAISTWSHSAHLELKSAAEAAYRSKEWRKLDWYKLPYRIDDVPNISRHILTIGFLPESEGAATFLAGRMHGAGYNKVSQSRTITGEVVESVENLAPTHISLQREAAMAELVPALHIAGQKFLVSSLSTMVLSGAFSALLVASDVSLYTALSAAALGTVASARWLQKRWQRERGGFQEAVREKARMAVVESERWAWSRLKEGSVEVDEEVERDMRMRRVLEEEVNEGLELCKK